MSKKAEKMGIEATKSSSAVGAFLLYAFSVIGLGVLCVSLCCSCYLMLLSGKLLRRNPLSSPFSLDMTVTRHKLYF